MKRLYETAIILIGTLGWWGFVYPDLCLTKDVYEEKFEAEEKAYSRTLMDEQGIQIGKLRIKSRIAEYVCQVKEIEALEKELENDE